MSIPETQKAFLLLAAYGDFALTPQAIPSLEAGDVLVRNEAIALNPVDYYAQKSPFGEKYLTFPAVIGGDFSGVVVKVGEGVTSLKEGDRVLASGDFNNRRGAYQEYSVAAARFASKIPDNVSFDEAASIPLTMVTAAIGFYQKAAMGAALVAPWEEGGRGHYKGTPILITGGASSVGCYGTSFPSYKLALNHLVMHNEYSAIQLAKLSGFSPIYTTASLKHTAYLESLGATHVIDRNLDFSDALSDHKGKIPYIMEVVSTGSALHQAPKLLAPGGTLVIYRPALEETLDLPEDAKIKLIFGSPFLPENNAVGEGLYEALGGWLKSGDVRANKVEVLEGGFNGVQEGLDRLAAGKVSGLKLIARPRETAGL